MATPQAERMKRADQLAQPLVQQVLPQLQRKFKRSRDTAFTELTMPAAVTREVFAPGEGDPDEYGRMVLDAVCSRIEKQLPGALVTAGRSEHRPNITYKPGDTAYFTVSASHG